MIHLYWCGICTDICIHIEDLAAKIPEISLLPRAYVLLSHTQAVTREQYDA